MNCSLFTLINSCSLSEIPSCNPPYFNQNIDLNFESSGLRFSLIKNDGDIERELSFDLTIEGSLELGHAIFSFFGQNWYVKYKSLLQKVKEAEKMPRFYSVWMVKFKNDPEIYEWQSGERELDTTHLTPGCIAWREFRPYSYYEMTCHTSFITSFQKDRE